MNYLPDQLKKLPEFILKLIENHLVVHLEGSFKQTSNRRAFAEQAQIQALIEPLVFDVLEKLIEKEIFKNPKRLGSLPTDYFYNFFDLRLLTSDTQQSTAPKNWFSQMLQAPHPQRDLQIHVETVLRPYRVKLAEKLRQLNFLTPSEELKPDLTQDELNLIDWNDIFSDHQTLADHFKASFMSRRKMYELSAAKPAQPF